MKKINLLFSLSIFAMALTSCGNTPEPEHVHKWGDPTYSWTSDYSKCTAKRVCELNSSHVDSETVSSTYEVTTQPTESSDGVGVYTATFSKEYFEVQTHTVDIPPIGHVHTFSDGYEYNETHHWHPATCGHDVKSGEAVHAFDVIEEGGVTTYTCSCGYSYSIGGDPAYKYEDNYELVKKYPELNTALKTLLNSKSFTLDHSQVYTPETPYYNKYNDHPVVLFANGNVKSVIKFTERDFEQTNSFTGEVYTSLQLVLSVYSVSSWSELLQNQEKSSHFKSQIYDALSSAGDLSSFSSYIDLSKADISEDKVTLLKSVAIVNTQTYDTEAKQYLMAATDGTVTRSQYIVPDNYVFQNIDVKYSVLEQMRLYAHTFSIGSGDFEFKYDEETHTYDRTYWGSGSSRFDFRFICPIVVENGVITSLRKMTVKDIGTTSITSKIVAPVCNHSHGTHQFWYSEQFHADYCDDCGKVLEKHSHAIHNDHGVCVECANFTHGLREEYGFEVYHPDYEELLDKKIYINPKTGKKYINYYASSAPVSPGITGKDGKMYAHFIDAPVDGQISEITFATNGNKHYLEDNTCFFVLEYVITKKTYNMTYLALTDETMPDNIYNDPEYMKEHYFNVTKVEVDSKVVDTVYSFVDCEHEQIDENVKFTVISLEQMAKECNYAYASFKYNSSDLNGFTFLKTTCKHCHKALYSAVSDNGLGRINDTFGIASVRGQYLTITYTWNAEYNECVGKLILITYVEYEQVPTTLVEESATVTLDSETSTITATFTNPIFKTQTEYVYN